MRLLVSVRSAAEAVLAASNGADIVDAKEPDAGPLGAVSASVLQEMELALPPHVPLGVALGDASTPDELAEVLDRLALRQRAGGVFLKVGFAGVGRVERVTEILRLAVDRARALGPAVAVIAAAYADYDRARTPSPAAILEAAIDAGAAGALIDTWVKDGRGLLRQLSPDALAAWVTRARGRGLLAALAGGLQPDDLSTLQAVGPDVVGVRGAVCWGGRAGALDAERLRGLRAAMRHHSVAWAPGPTSAGEMPEPAPHLAPLSS
jgi:(5-formylfuran-3-yl)methyl phosphate synthase